ncbi:hypothetical protein DBV15_00112 [Temnothorax longispinosus]|uniref:Uncharacterized protein n=1 Tax=Temnothorax longispinosus TaxID=300112 RepID=A0A4S2KHS0_9HYME|nr:hypothetical protein DBV15_00112 [Temnothorax longispinosus]
MLKSGHVNVRNSCVHVEEMKVVGLSGSTRVAHLYNPSVYWRDHQIRLLSLPFAKRANRAFLGKRSPASSDDIKSEKTESNQALSPKGASLWGAQRKNDPPRPNASKFKGAQFRIPFAKGERINADSKRDEEIAGMKKRWSERQVLLDGCHKALRKVLNKKPERFRAREGNSARLPCLSPPSSASDHSTY